MTDQSEDVGFLPPGLEPVHYDIRLFDMDLDSEPRTFRGSATIEIAVTAPTDSITLNVHQLSDFRAELRPDQPKVIGIDHEPAMQFLHIRLESSLEPGSVIQLNLHWRGFIGSDVGFYRSGPGSMYCTQFQPVDARRAFPAFDEPGFKSTFELALEVPEAFVALSNMPISSSRPSETNAGRKWVSFEKTPRMVCYLLAWAFGPMKYVETVITRTHAPPLPVRIYSTPEAASLTSLALDIAKRCMELFAKMFGVDFPLPKIDLLAVPEMTDGAMENWGLCIFRSTCLLLDGEVTLNPEGANEVVYTIAHELAHQWFGNLVTMSKWDELWLNEGFATWAGWYATDHIYPDWQVGAQFVFESMGEAFGLDALASSHPVQVHVQSGLAVDETFDSITYLKGSSIIRMLATYLGQDRFIKGVGQYLRDNAYGSTTGDALWDALSRETGEDVAALIEPWIKQVGCPQLTLSPSDRPGHIRLQQQRYGLTSDDTIWWIPIVIQTSQGPERVHLDASQADFHLQSSLVKLNQGSTGFYRIIMPTEHTLSLGQRLNELCPEDRVALLSDTYAVVYTGAAHSIGTVLDLVRQYSNEKSAIVWWQVIGCLRELDSVFGLDPEIASGLLGLKGELVQPHLADVTWQPSPSDSYNTARLRPQMLREAGFSGLEGGKYTDEALRVYQSSESLNKLPFPLQRVVCDLAIRKQGLPAVKMLVQRYHEAPTEGQKDAFIRSMAVLTDPTEARTFVEMAFRDAAIATQDLSTLCAAMSRHGTTTDVIWEFVMEEWDLVYSRMGDVPTTLERFLLTSLCHMTNMERVAEINAFFKRRDTTGYARSLDVSVNMIKANAAFKDKEHTEVKRWLRAHGYIGAKIK